ncbi:hydantoinase B/oxoprolinase family protein [Rhodococcus opacus]|uniref:hydantoinase B/oxoprolinase family protein n=1 Tax=Rhodococcus opacus TaxID=37919 RepID=UPI0029493628|nr:hydantoinase B/oxoprolinase family protein [Rhodococcus opacus]MDV6247194.1 hydantoinase B/oxoprolinase family protein [Rhodococcus opacus]
MTNPADEILRDLTDQQFNARYNCDRFTAALINKRLVYAVEHMSTAFFRQAFSPIVAQWYDFSCAISGPPELDYPVSAVSDSLLVFVGTMPDVVRNAVEEFGPDNLRPGDILIVNDPYRIGGHVNDLAFIKPVFLNGKIVSFVSMRVHQLDIGGVTPGGFGANKRNVYENGLVIPPMLLFSEGKPVKHVFSLFFDNTRFGGLIQPDMFSTAQQLSFGENLLLDNVERYGLDAVLGSMVYAVDANAEIMRTAIARIPDGDYTGTTTLDADGIDANEEFTVVVTIRKRGVSVEVDLTGTTRQAQTCLNATFIDTSNAVGSALSMLLAPGVQFTSGNWRNIDTVIPGGTIASALPPDGAVFFYWETASCILGAVFKALNPVLGEDAMAGDMGSSNAHSGTGLMPDGTPWACIAQVGGEQGPWGATKHGDGDSYVVSLMLNCVVPGLEGIEAQAPVTVLANEIVPDSGGAGYHRGGAAVRRETYWHVDGEHFITPLRTKDHCGFGANGGKDGSLAAVWAFDPEVANVPGRAGSVPLDNELYARSRPIAGLLDPDTKLQTGELSYHHYGSSAWKFEKGTVMRVLTNGAGGWGDPLTRKVESVVADVRNGYVTIEGAAANYGVAILGDPYNDPEGLTVDEERTRQLRAS